MRTGFLTPSLRIILIPVLQHDFPVTLAVFTPIFLSCHIHFRLQTCLARKSMVCRRSHSHRPIGLAYHLIMESKVIDTGTACTFVFLFLLDSAVSLQFSIFLYTNKLIARYQPRNNWNSPIFRVLSSIAKRHFYIAKAIQDSPNWRRNASLATLEETSHEVTTGTQVASIWLEVYRLGLSWRQLGMSRAGPGGVPSTVECGREGKRVGGDDKWRISIYE